jgi:predicted RNase H-like nuclease (RuvC/YqgF family)
MLLKIFAIALVTSSICYGQSLGDVARENRERTAEDAAIAPPLVVTTADFPKNTHANPAPSDSQVEKSNQAAEQRSAQRSEQRLAQQRIAQQRAAQQWKQQILAQKAKMANLQARITQLHESIQAANGSVQFEGPSNQYQARQLQQVAQIQQQLEVQKIRLDQMQDAARHAGMHSAVYDP